MQGLHVFEPETRTVIDLESFIPDDHLLREVDRFIEPAFIRKLTAACYADGLGRPSIDPVVYFRMVLVPISTASRKTDVCVKKYTSISPTAGSADSL